jgi:hypothetical protein
VSQTETQKKLHPPNVAKEICFLFVRLPWQIQMVVIFLNLREWKETKEQGKECFVVSFGEFHLESLAFLCSWMKIVLFLQAKASEVLSLEVDGWGSQ